jgi:hypothetical protein
MANPYKLHMRGRRLSRKENPFLSDLNRLGVKKELSHAHMQQLHTPHKKTLTNTTKMSASAALSAAPAADIYDSEDNVLTMGEVSDVIHNTSSDDDGMSNDDETSNNDEETEDSLFLCAARDIMNRTRWKVGTAAMEDRRFRSLFGVLPDHLNGVGHAGGEPPAPQEEQAKASALDALFFEGISKVGPRMLHCWWVEGCRRPQDNAEMGVAVP